MVTKIAAGWHHSVALTKEFNVYTTGLGQFGQLGHENEELKTLFTWVKKLGGKKVIDISAGGHHTWCTLDQYERKVSKYSPPSPLKTSPATSPEHDHKEKKPSKPLFKLNHGNLGLVFTGVAQSHRIIRVRLQAQRRGQLEDTWAQYVRTIQEEEKGLQLHTLNEDKTMHHQVATSLTTSM